MTDAERQARCVLFGPVGHRQSEYGDHLITTVAPSVGCDAISELTTLRGHYAAWLEALPENLQDSAADEVLQAICDLDLTELLTIVPPRGLDRD
jgi:hypothetical protein